MDTPVSNMLTINVGSFVSFAGIERSSSAAVMNLSHVISEFSFGPHFPDIVQPLDYTFEVTHDRKRSYFRSSFKF